MKNNPSPISTTFKWTLIVLLYFLFEGLILGIGLIFGSSVTLAKNNVTLSTVNGGNAEYVAAQTAEGLTRFLPFGSVEILFLTTFIYIFAVAYPLYLKNRNS